MTRASESLIVNGISKISDRSNRVIFSAIQSYPSAEGENVRRSNTETERKKVRRLDNNKEQSQTQNVRT
jgi:hypothetical protein